MAIDRPGASPATDWPRTVTRALWAATPVLLVALVLVVWWALATLADKPRIYPDPIAIVGEIGDIVAGESGLGPTLDHLGPTLFRLASGWGLAMALGTILGLLAGRSRALFGFLENVVWVLMATPSIVWVFIFAVAIGISDWIPILVLTAILGPQTLINVAEGTKAMPRELSELADAYKVGHLQRLTDVYAPYLLPYVLSSARSTFATATKIILIAEVIALSSGIGYVVAFWQQKVFFGPVLAWGVLFTLFGITVDRLVFRTIEERAAPWSEHRTARALPTID